MVSSTNANTNTNNSNRARTSSNTKGPLLLKLLLEAQKLISRDLHKREFILGVIEDKGLTVAQIARIFGNKRQSIQLVANELVSEGVCIFTENYFHRKSKLLTLTPRGRKILAQNQKAFELKAQKITSTLSLEKLANATSVLKSLNG